MDYEGGGCTPFSAHWPSVIKPDTITNQVGHFIDVTPTFVDISGAEYLKEINGNKTFRRGKLARGKVLSELGNGNH